MPQLFLSHSSADNAASLALSDWLRSSGWESIFLDIHRHRGLLPGQRWPDALQRAMERSEAALFLISPAWLASEWCRRELEWASKLNKRLIGALIGDVAITDVPPVLTSTWHLVRLDLNGAQRSFIVQPEGQDVTKIDFSEDGLKRLKRGLELAGLDASFFDWPPENDPERSPYPGLVALQSVDAGIFFGRDAPLLEALDKLRQLRDEAGPRIFAVLGASGAGKSSFLRAGLLPRLERDDANFLVLPVVRPNRGTMWGESGLAESLRQYCAAHPSHTDGTDPKLTLQAAVAGETSPVSQLLITLLNAAAPSIPPQEEIFQLAHRQPSLVLSVDQSEELFLSEFAGEAEAFFRLVRVLLTEPALNVILIFTARTDCYEQLQSAKGVAAPLEGLRQMPFSLPTLPRGEYGAVITGPAKRLRDNGKGFLINPLLVNRLLDDLGRGDAKDSLPLLAITMDRLFRAYGHLGELRREQYEQLGGLAGAIESAFEAAFEEALRLYGLFHTRADLLTMLRGAFIPWLAEIDNETGVPRRRVALFSELDARTLPLIRLLVDARLLTTDGLDGETVELAHEAIMRQWKPLREWLIDEHGALTTLGALRQATAEWHYAKQTRDGLQHRGRRLLAAEELLARPDFAKAAGTDAAKYLLACRQLERDQFDRDRRKQRQIGMALAGVAVVLVAGTIGVGKVWQGLNQRTSNTLAAMALQASNAGQADRALRYALAAAWNRDAYFVGFDASKAEDVLRVTQQRNGAVSALRHADQVRTAVISEDGRQVLTASFDRSAALWDARTGARLRQFLGHEAKVESAVFSPNGQTVVTTSFDGTARIWDATAADGPALHILQHPHHLTRPNQIWRAAFSQDGRIVATAANDSKIRLWDVQTGALLREFGNHGNIVRDILFTPNEGSVLSTSEDGDVRLWDPATGVQIKDFVRPEEATKGLTAIAVSQVGNSVAIGYAKGIVAIWTGTVRRVAPITGGPNNFIRQLRFHPTEPLLLGASSDGNVYLWDTENVEREPRRLRLPGGQAAHSNARGAIFSPNGRSIVTVGEDRAVRLWDTDGTLRFEYGGHEGPVWSADFSSTEQFFVTASADGRARVWDATIHEANDVKILTGHTRAVRAVAFSPNGRLVATGSFAAGDDFVRVWDVESGKVLHMARVGQVQALTFSPDSRLLATATVDTNRAEIWELARCRHDGTVNCRYGPPMLHGGRVMDVDFSPSGTEIVTASRDNRASIWNLLSPDKPRQEFYHWAGASTSAFSPSGRLVVSASYEDAYIWDAGSGSEICRLIGHTQAVRSAAFSRDGLNVITASEDRTVRIWSASNCKELNKLALDGDSIWSAHFSPDGRDIVVASQAFRQARIFDRLSLKQRAALVGHRAAVYSAVFSPDGRWVASASDDTTARIWPVPLRENVNLNGLERQLCEGRLKGGLSAFSDAELAEAPVLDRQIDVDACRPPSPLSRLLRIFSQTR